MMEASRIGIAAIRPIFCVLRKSGASLSKEIWVPDFVVVRSVCLQDIAQVGFAKHDEVVE